MPFHRKLKPVNNITIENRLIIHMTNIDANRIDISMGQEDLEVSIRQRRTDRVGSINSDGNCRVGDVSISLEDGQYNFSKITPSDSGEMRDPSKFKSYRMPFWARCAYGFASGAALAFSNLSVPLSFSTAGISLIIKGRDEFKNVWTDIFTNEVRHEYVSSIDKNMGSSRSKVEANLKEIIFNYDDKKSFYENESVENLLRPVISTLKEEDKQVRHVYQSFVALNGEIESYLNNTKHTNDNISTNLNNLKELTSIYMDYVNENAHELGENINSFKEYYENKTSHIIARYEGELSKARDYIRTTKQDIAEDIHNTCGRIKSNYKGLRKLILEKANDMCNGIENVLQRDPDIPGFGGVSATAIADEVEGDTTKDMQDLIAFLALVVNEDRYGEAATEILSEEDVELANLHSDIYEVTQDAAMMMALMNAEIALADKEVNRSDELRANLTSSLDANNPQPYMITYSDQIDRLVEIMDENKRNITHALGSDREGQEKIYNETFSNVRENFEKYMSEYIIDIERATLKDIDAFVKGVDGSVDWLIDFVDTFRYALLSVVALSALNGLLKGAAAECGSKGKVKKCLHAWLKVCSIVGANPKFNGAHDPGYFPALAASGKATNITTRNPRKNLAFWLSFAAVSSLTTREAMAPLFSIALMGTYDYMLGNKNFATLLPDGRGSRLFLNHSRRAE